MATCLITAGIPIGCRGVGGVNSGGVYIGTYQLPNQGGYTISATGSNGEITSFSFTGSATASFYQFEADTEVDSMTSKPVVSVENGTAYSEITVTFTIFNFNQQLQNTMNSLMRGRWSMILQGNNGVWYYLGYDNPGDITDGDAGVHKALGDLDGATFTMTFKEYNGARQILYNAQNTVIVLA